MAKAIPRAAASATALGTDCDSINVVRGASDRTTVRANATSVVASAACPSRLGESARTPAAISPAANPDLTASQRNTLTTSGTANHQIALFLARATRFVYTAGSPEA